MQIERRFIKGGQLRAKKDGKPGIEGVGAVYNQQYDSGWMIEIMKPGAFARALKEKQDVRCLFNHDPNNVLGRTKSGTLAISDASDGLHFTCDTDAETRIGSDVRSMIERGDVDGCSISFSVRSQTWREEKDDSNNWITYREIEDVDLYDVGPVTFPAYEQTSVQARSALWPDGVPAEVRSHIASLRAEGDKVTKRVDNEDLTADCFLIVLDPKKTDTWNLPWKFSTEEKTKSHLRDALARFDQLEGVSDEEKKRAWKELLKLCKRYGIDVSDEDHNKYSKRADECACACDACQDGRCEDCDCDGNCDAENCGNEECNCGEGSRMRMRLRLAEASL